MPVQEPGDNQTPKEGDVPTQTYNKIIINGTTYIDLSADTVAAANMLSGITAHDKNGAAVTGTIPTKTASNVTIDTTGANAGKVTVSAGYYASQVQKAMANASITLSDPAITANPTITKETASGSNQGKIKATVSGSGTSTATVSTAGFVSSISDTGNATVSGSTYTTAESIESNLIAANVKTGVKIFQTTGTFTSDGTAIAGEILSGKIAYSQGNKLTGTMSNRGSNNVTVTTKSGTTIPAGYYDGGGKAVIDSTSATNLVAANILKDKVILGVTGTLDPASEVTTAPLEAVSKFTSQTILPGDIDPDVQFISEVTIAPITVDISETSGTTGYTVTVSEFSAT